MVVYVILSINTEEGREISLEWLEDKVMSNLEQEFMAVIPDGFYVYKVKRTHAEALIPFLHGNYIDAVIKELDDPFYAWILPY